MNAKSATSTAAEVRAAAAGELLDAAGTQTEDLSALNVKQGARAYMGRIERPGASWDLLMVTVVLLRAVLLESTRVMLTQ